MIRPNVQIQRAAYLFAVVMLIAIGLLTNTIPLVLAQTSGTWTSTGSLNTPRTGHTATLLSNGQILVVGGEDSAGILNSAELYNPATGGWTFTASMATPRINHSATLLPNGEVLVAGGDNSTGLLNSAELYNPATGRWTTTGTMNVPRALHGAVVLRNGQVLVAAGNNAVGSSGNTAELYNPSTGTWHLTAEMQSFHAFTLTLLLDGRALAVDDSNSTGAPGELYNPSSGQWTLTGGMYYAHSGNSIALLTNGEVLAYGNHFACYAAQVFNPSANTWTRTMGQCGTGISNGPLALLGTGKVLLAGGATSYRSLTTHCFLYDPSTNSWAVTGSLKAAAGHTATRLLNGQVLAVGGADAELYTP